MDSSGRIHSFGGAKGNELRAVIVELTREFGSLVLLSDREEEKLRQLTPEARRELYQQLVRERGALMVEAPPARPKPLTSKERRVAKQKKREERKAERARKKR